MAEFSVSLVIGSVIGNTVGTVFRTVNERIAKVGDTVKSLNDRKTVLESQFRRTVDSAKLLNTTMRTTNDVSERMKLQEKFARTQMEASRLARAINEVKTSMDKVASHKLAMEENRAFRQQFRSDLLGKVATAAVVAAPVKVAMDFESAMADVSKVVNFATVAEEKAFGRSLLQKSITTIPLAAADLATIAAAGGQFGIAKEKLGGFTDIVAKMSIAFGMTSEQSGESIAKIMNIYRLGIGETERLGDAMNRLGNNMAAKERDIINVVSRIGGTAQVFGLTGKQASSLGAAMLALGQTPEVAATSLDAFMNKLGAAETQGNDFQQGLASIGLSAQDIKEKLKTDAQGTILDVLTKLQKLDDSQLRVTLNNMFGLHHAPDVALLVKGMDEYKKAIGLVASESAYAGSMQEEFKKRSEVSAYNVQRFKNSLAAIGITVGSILLPAVNSVLKPVTSLLSGMAWLAEKFPTVTKIIGGTAMALTTLSIAASVAKYAGTILSDGYHIVAGALSNTTAGTWLYVTAIDAYTVVTGLATKAMTWFNATILANPITWVVVGIVAAVTALYMLWKHWDAVNAKIKEWTGFDLSAAGRRIIKSLTDGIKSMLPDVGKIMDTVTQKIKNFLPFSPAKEGPLKDLHRVNIIGTIADTIKPGPVQAALSKALQVGSMAAALTPLGMMLSGGGQAPTLQGQGFKVEVTQIFNFNGQVDDKTLTQVGTHASDGLQEALSKFLEENQRHSERVNW